MKTALSFLSVLASVAASLAADVTVYPPAVQLRSPHGDQQLVVVGTHNGVAVDLTTKATYASSDRQVATVSAQGLISRVGAGTATITATVDGRSATMLVKSLPGQFDWSFTQHVEPTLTRTGCNSGACHGALAGKGGFKLSLRGYDPESDWFTITRQAQARRADTAQADDSLLLKKAIRKLPHGGGTRFADDSKYYSILKTWIAAGANGPDAKEAAVTKLDVYPKDRLAAAGDQFRIVAVATFADGHTEDVTGWAKFTSSEEQVAVVDEDGQVKIAGSGVAGVSVVFASNVATATVMVPFRTKDFTPSKLSASASMIDRQIDEMLNRMRLSPSPTCTDEEFIRRAMLDVCGIVPTPKDLQTFVDSKAEDKRTKLIDALLNRPEHVDYWTYRLSEMLLVSTRDLPSTANWSYYQTLRKAVADNRPWDRMARDLLTGTGSTLEHGTGNYFVLHKDVAKLAETTAITFLGTSIGCAKCHNHPLEKWTQDQYWQFANLFSRVQLKNGEVSGEVIVSVAPTGEALHPRRGIPMTPAPLDGPALSLNSSVDRRVHFADWLTSKDNSYFAKAMVNRIWKMFMGRGLVEAEDDLRATNPPTNPQLLDALTKEFVSSGYDMKALMRSILTSNAYGRSSNPTAGNAADDRFYSRYFLRRLPAEVILDAYSQITGVATPFDTVAVGASGGFAKRGDFPAGTRAVQLPDSLLVSRFLDQFGRAERLQACACERGNDSSVSQALHVSNGQTLNDKLRDEKSIVSKWVMEKTPDDEVITQAFRLTLCRAPSESERKIYRDTLAKSANRKEAIEDVLWALLTGREFLFNR